MALRDVVICLCGVLLGFLFCVLLVMTAIITIGDAFHIENINVTVALNQTALEDLIKESPGYQVAGATEVQNLTYNGIYGWFCDDTSTYEPAIVDETPFYVERKCHLVSIETYGGTNRSVYIENGWRDLR